MRAVVSRVKQARVEIQGESCGEIGSGLLIYLGVGQNDTEDDARYLASKAANLRVFEDEKGKMNLSPSDIGAQMLVISNFTLYGNCRSRRPDFMNAAKPELAVPLYELFVSELKNAGFGVFTGRFGADMQVFSQGDGPITLVLDTDVLRKDKISSGSERT
jgi:D-tyrosyl-tRNA(Tyr) deacylase